eukprot:309125-Pyramimonas_sp.AAC.1
MVPMFSGRGRKLIEGSESSGSLPRPVSEAAGGQGSQEAAAGAQQQHAEPIVLEDSQDAGGAGDDGLAEYSGVADLETKKTIQLLKDLGTTASAWLSSLSGHEYADHTKKEIENFIDELYLFVAMKESIHQSFREKFDNGQLTRTEGVHREMGPALGEPEGTEGDLRGAAAPRGRETQPRLHWH